ncbi:MAG: hypothetical protein AB4911_03015 [Oscillochloridaceae bacterium umkhey_bin13]
MTTRTITVTLSEPLFLQLEAAARSSAQSLETVITQTLERTIPVPLASGLPPSLQAELAAMEHLSDDALRSLAYSTSSPAQQTQLDVLIEQKQQGSLKPEQAAQLTTLRQEAEALMVRKAHAFVLLKSRGIELPRLDQLPVPEQ